MRKTFAFVIRLLVALSVALPLQRVAAQDAKLGVGLLSIAEAKAKEPRLMNEAEQAKAYQGTSRAEYEAFQKSVEATAARSAWRDEHDRKFNAINAPGKIGNFLAPAQIHEAIPGGVPIEPTPAPQSRGLKTLQKPDVFQGSPRNINVVVIHYATVVTGVSVFPYIVGDTVNALNLGSKFQGAGAQSLNYNRIATYTVNGAAPTINLPYAGIYNTGLYTRLMDIATIYNTYNLCAQFASGTLDQVWIYSDGFSAPSQVEFAVNGTDWDVYNGYMNVPKCGKAGTFFEFIYANLVGGNWYPAQAYQGPHSYTHYVETAMSFRQQWDYAVCDAVDGDGRNLSGYTGLNNFATAYCPSRPFSWTRGFSAHANANNGNVAVCGDVHFPPTATGTLSSANSYVYTQTTPVNSICNTWNWTGSPAPVGISCLTWSPDCTDVNASAYSHSIWWMQRIPSATTNATDRSGATRGNFWNNIPTRIPAANIITRNDYNFDGKTDFAIFRPSDGKFYVKYSGVAGNTGSPAACLMANSIPRTGKFSTNTNYWLVYQSSTGNFYDATGGACSLFSTIGTNLSVGSAKFSYVTQTVQSDAWRYSPLTGGWTISLASGASGPFPANFSLGATGSVAVIDDYDGDGIADPATYKPSTGAWSFWNSAGLVTTTLSWANSANFIPVVADYDGDKKADVAVYDTVYHTWYIRQTVNGQTLTVNWGAAGDIPIAADFDGDGYANVAIFRPSTGDWGYLKRDGTDSWTQYGGPGDVPLSNRTW